MTEQRVIPPRWGALSPGGVVVTDSTDRSWAATKVENENRSGPLPGWRVIRTCGCGCKQSMEGRDSRAVCVDGQHRARAWKAMTGYGRETRRQVRTNGRSKSGGLQVSFGKAVDVIAGHLEAAHSYTDDGARSTAESLLALALSDRQRERLEASR